MTPTILIAIGANLPSRFGAPRETCEEAVRRLAGQVITVCACSPWYESAPLPGAGQPWYVNGVVMGASTLPPAALLAGLHRIEADMGRVRALANAPRVIDLDLLAHGTQMIEPKGPNDLCVPHPRMQGRAFVMLPLRDVAPDWVHPVSGRAVCEIVAALPKDQRIRRAKA